MYLPLKLAGKKTSMKKDKISPYLILQDGWKNIFFFFRKNKLNMNL